MRIIFYLAVLMAVAGCHGLEVKRYKGITNEYGDYKGLVSCGCHDAPSCSQCGTQPHLCNGDCKWNSSGCMLKGSCKCGKKKVGTRVVGGRPTEVNEYPWMVGVSDQEESTFYFCGGALVAAQWVVTAAHCIQGEDDLFVTLGDHDTTSDAESVIKTIKVEKRIGHPDYGTKTGDDNDFALLKLSESVDLNTYTPACLPAAWTDYTGQNGWIVGWGDDQKQRQVRTDVLNELQLPIVSDSVCQQAFADKGFNYTITSDMVCAGGGEGKDGCFGDSGGPFTVDTMGQHFLVGAVSWGEGCARDGLYGVYVEVAMFREWMDQQFANSGGAEYCPVDNNDGGQ